MMIGERTQSIPTVHIPPWTASDDSVMGVSSPISVNAFPVNFDVNAGGGVDCSLHPLDSSTPLQPNVFTEFHSLNGENLDRFIGAFSSDDFRMFQFKIRRCPRGRSHDWTECPFAHPGEKARRRDPRKCLYSGMPCPEFRKGHCMKGESCEFAHGVFECWLHPARYRTQPCKDGIGCRRRVCFFAHTPDQLRVLVTHESADSFDGSPKPFGSENHRAKGSFISSPTSIIVSPPFSPPSDSPPMSPQCHHGSFNSTSALVASMRNLQMAKRPTPWGLKVGSGWCSHRSSPTSPPVFQSLPSTPTHAPRKSGLSHMDPWDGTCSEEPAIERVESGRDLRARMYAKLSKENSLERGSVIVPAADIDFGWVSDLVE